MKLQPTFFVSVKIWLDSNMYTWAFSWIQRTWRV